MTDFKTLAANSNAWPFQEAILLAERLKNKLPAKGYVLFETGYGPSGLPHIGTFMEVFRTTLVRRAFEKLTDMPTKLFCISDDMDGLRKIPENVPNKDMLIPHLGKALTSIPDPFGTHESYGAHMNAKLCSFLDHYGFEYEFHSSTENYKKGLYDKALLKALEKYDEIQAVMLPTLGDERASNYSPFMPVSPKSGKVLQTEVVERNVGKGTITYKEEDGSLNEIPVTGGHCKLQWKPDFGMRWAALDVDYEMYGKDHQPSAPLYNDICKVLGGACPQQYVYELFLDSEGKKISKSKGNGVSLEQWLRYGPPESLSYYMFGKPRTAKRLSFDVIPRAVDEYQTMLEKFPKEDAQAQVNNPVWHIHEGKPPLSENIPSYNLLLNLAGVANVEDPKILWGFINNYLPQFSPSSHPFLDLLVHGAIHYYQDFVKPTKKYRFPTEAEIPALTDLAAYLESTADTTADALQTQIYEIGKKYFADNLKGWFSCMYETLLGQPQGPRMGSFVALYGKADTAKLVRRVLAKENLAA